MLSFDPGREPSVPRDAATIIVLRAGAGGPEVFCVQRHKASGFLGGAVVFPGGKVDPGDADPLATAGLKPSREPWASVTTSPHPRGAILEGPGGLPAARTLGVAACREALEEAGLVPTEPPLDAERTERLRSDAARDGFFAALTETALGTSLALDKLVPWARWITPEAEARRFDARFYLLELPVGQVGKHDNHETTTSFWATPEDVLGRSERGEIFLAPPTIRTLELLSGHASVAAAMAVAERQSLLPICPVFVPDDSGGFLALPGDPAHQVRERRVDGPTRFVLRDGRFVSTDAPH